MRKWIEVWDEIHMEVERTVPVDDGVAAFVRWRAHGRDGVEVDSPSCSRSPSGTA